MNKKTLEKKLDEINKTLKKTESIYLQIISQKSLLIELIKQEEELEKNKDK